ncbi:phage head closure protein [Paracoccus sp. ME4]|uniref:phage head closure protein n=1 Tax=Paracoccus sp. ME4 TaxID=3138066 RepID=UPI00398A6251
MDAGSLRDRATFEGRANQSDGFGNQVGAWTAAFYRRCHVRFLRGTESVLAARLEGRQPVIITVRNDRKTKAITPDMRVILYGRPYNIREHPRPSDDDLFLEFLAESGVADG